MGRAASTRNLALCAPSGTLPEVHGEPRTPHPHSCLRHPSGGQRPAPPHPHQSHKSHLGRQLKQRRPTQAARLLALWVVRHRACRAMHMPCMLEWECVCARACTSTPCGVNRAGPVAGSAGWASARRRDGISRDWCPWVGT
eukprot:358731-Chlamydomonas_euryale.AAC.1